jgi:hypothetical protein
MGLGEVGGIFDVVRSASHEWHNPYCGRPCGRAAHHAAILKFLLMPHAPEATSRLQC